jgi:hypothetical protein
MKSGEILSMLSAVLLGIGTVVATGCVEQPEDRAAETGGGTVSVPLVTTTNGHVYRLSNAVVFIFGPYTTFTLTSSDDPNETVLSQALSTGRYQSFLQSWTLEKQGPDGAFHPVQATLISSPSSFDVFNGATTTISYEFASDGSIIRIGSGNLQVAVNVTETSPVCTPFGAECGAGNWCPPTELTGTVPACYPAGSIEIGQPCDAPTSCIAGASCFDLGTAPICAALCSDSAFGESCASGGICEPRGVSYGVCR